MMTLREELIEGAGRQVNMLMKACQALRDLPDVVVEKAYGGFVGVDQRGCTVWLYLPADPKVYLACRRALWTAGWKIDRIYSRGANRVFENDTGVAVNLSITYDKSRGATCERIQVGEARKLAYTVPKYKVVCA
jgi:hypothetical protein